MLAIIFLIGVIAADRFVTKIIAATAPTQSPAMCYSQCGFYKFFWKGDFCYDMVATNCTASFNLKDVVSMVKTIRDSFLTGKLEEIVDVKPLFTAWLICKPLIEDCIVPQLDACATTCQSNTVYYAPNLTTGSEYGYFQGLYYDDTAKTLSMRVMNTGAGYAWNIGVSMSYGSTDKQDGSGMSDHSYFSETIPELLFLGSRQAQPVGVSDIVTDFLIDQSNFSKFLARFKSDAGNHYIPPGWEKTIPFGVPDGKLTRIILNVDPNQDIVESNESDNTYILEIDKRPKPASFDITNIEMMRQGNTLTDYLVRFTVNNSGELAGEAKLSLFEGGNTDGIGAFHTQTKHVDEKGSTVFEKMITVDVSNGSPSCSTSKRFTATVTDDKGVSRSVRFDIPLYAGVITGRVTNTKGKAVVGATVTASTGQTATTSAYGTYRIKGIATLGNVTLTISHSSYTESQTKEATLTLSTSKNMMNACMADGLTVSNIDAVLRDIPVKLTIKLKNTQGQDLTGNVMLTGPAGTKTYEVNGEKVIDEADVGQFSVTAGSPGYITKFIQSMLTPPEQTLEITLEKLNGRPTDAGLTLITPVKLWEKTLPNKVDDIEGTKNGKLLVVYTSKNTAISGQLHFINPVNGEFIKNITVPSTRGQQQEGLDVSYDGRTVGFMVNPGGFGLTETERIVKVFNATGNEVASTTVDKHNAASMAVSPDGFYLYPTSLMNNSLYKYTRLEMEGIGEKALQSYAASEQLDFLHNNTIVASCKTGLCIKTLASVEIRTLGRTNGAVRAIDSTFDDSTIIVRTDKGLAFFGGAGWEKELKRDPAFVSAAITPGGEYVIVANGGNGNNTLSILKRSGEDATPQYKYNDVRSVEANDRGLFFTTAKSNKIAYYQIGTYATEYKPPADSEDTAQTQTGNLEIYVNLEKKFKPTGYLMSWDNMASGVMYKTMSAMTLTTPWGNLKLGDGTVIARSPTNEPLLVWGQAEVNASSPITMVIIKSKLYDVVPMADKVEKYWLGELAPEDYVLVKNLHTRYEAKNTANTVLVTVLDGNVEIRSKDIQKNIYTNQVAKIVENKITVGTNWMKYIVWIIITVGICIAGSVIFVFRKHHAH